MNRNGAHRGNRFLMIIIMLSERRRIARIQGLLILSTDACFQEGLRRGGRGSNRDLRRDRRRSPNYHPTQACMDNCNAQRPNYEVIIMKSFDLKSREKV